MKIWHCIPTADVDAGGDGVSVHDLTSDCLCVPELQPSELYENLDWADGDLLYVHNQFSPLPKEEDEQGARLIAYLETQST